MVYMVFTFGKDKGVLSHEGAFFLLPHPNEF